MNCANHADASAVAYCRTCGKALCANCTRPVRGVIYCEDCLGARMENTVPAEGAGFDAGFPPPPPPPPIPPATPFTTIPPIPPALGISSGPNPALAGILAGFFPFGVGAVYTGQYAKGLAHLAIFGLLIAGCNVGNGHLLSVICGLGIAFFVVYQIIDAVRSARALQMGLPAPDPYGLAQTFTVSDKIDTSKIPAGAVVLILIGVALLLHTLGVFEVSVGRFWPLILIALGGWLLFRNFGLLGPGFAPASVCFDPRTRFRRMMGPAMLLTIGILFLLQNLDVANFDRTWPIILLVIGGVKLLQSSGMGPGPWSPPGSGMDTPGAPPTPPEPPIPPPPPSEVSHG